MPLRLLLGVVLLGLQGLPALALEPWIDAQLPLTNHIELWLDGSRQVGVRQLQGARWLSEGAPIDRWIDGSGRKRDALQWVRESMPQFRSGGGVAWARFDGRNDYLAIDTGGLQLINLTLFLVATPRANPGWFSGFLSMSESGRNDYVHGLNVDLGPMSSTRMDWLNVESAGAGGAFNFVKRPVPFGGPRVISVTVNDAARTVVTQVDFEAPVERPRTASAGIRASQIFLGARYYSNTSDPASVSGFLEGDVAEVLLYRVALNERSREQVAQYLASKYSQLAKEAAHAGQGLSLNPLVPVEDPAPVQMLVPGFEAIELPIELPNLNCVKYRPDGKLMGLGYNGRLYLLSDTDGDGTEDRAEVFWDGDSLRAPVGMALTPPGYPHGQGAFIAAKGRLSLIVDTNHDDRADREIIVAEGWRELPHGVDALGVAMDRDGTIYFGLGTTDFTNAYQVDRATGRPRYRLNDERGTILKVSPDFSRREIIATGIRFPVALAFNAQGDLFCTDQEGATWLPNGNPLDELLHIQPGRHYGFPPRHPRYLPDVIDEPSTFDYSPQHQSVCGLNFNESVHGGPTFGPGWWKGDAIVTGYSRGKLYRTTLVRTDAGYVASSQLFGCLSQLTVDACVSPRGDLVVAVHSGQPDWGSGPNGLGKLYRIRYRHPELPQPRLIWAVSPTETDIAWDRPLSAEEARVMIRECAVAGGSQIAAGDRFEVMRPGYQVVQDQLAASRRPIPVLATQLSADRRMLRIITEPRVEAINYVVALHDATATNAVKVPAGYPATAKSSGGVPHRIIDLAYSLHGVEAAWKGSGQSNEWKGWLPSFDSTVNESLTTGSAAHEGWRRCLSRDGELQLRSRLNLWQMLRPAVQPGSKIDYSLPPEEVELCFRGTGDFEVRVDGERMAPTRGEVVVRHAPQEGRWILVEAHVRTGSVRPHLQVTWRTAEDSRERPLALHRLFLPWAVPQGLESPASVQRVPEEVRDADWLAGRAIFFGEAAGCARCHRLRGEGASVGPDLSNLVHRDHASVLQDILQPNAAMNPDHIAYNVELTDGEGLVGVLKQSLTNAVVFALADGAKASVPRDRIRSMVPSTLSLMPEGLAQGLDPKSLKDLMAFLLVAPVTQADLQTEIPPDAVRELTDMEPLFAGIPRSSASKDELFDIVLVAGPKDHGPDEHDYPLWQERWKQLLALARGVRVTTADGWPSVEQMARARVLVFYSNNPGWSAERAVQLKAYQDRGGGLVYIHFAVDGHRDVEALAERIGLAWRGGASKFRHGALDLDFSKASHPISHGFKSLHLHDESYWNLVGDPTGIRVLATGIEDGIERPLLWVRENGAGRVFVSIPGHYTWTFDDPAFRLLLLRGICWAGKEPEDRLSDLATVGARFAE